MSAPDRTTRFETPVLLLAWRRPETTRQVIEAIRAIAPTRMFVACDGPRPGNAEDAERVAACRALIDREIDWPCTVERLYSESNLGCGDAVRGALHWFFGRVEQGIVLEDDCVAHADFFWYCAELLDRYRDDTRVWAISGDNFQDGQWRGDGSYYFSHYNHCWGWASWRRAWQHFDELQRWPELKASGLLPTIFDDPVEARYWAGIWDQTKDWDYQWTFTCLSHGGLTALPNRNLVRNVGFGDDATHTTNASYYGEQSVAGILPLKHPGFLLRDREADRYSFDHHFGGESLRQSRTLLSRLRRRARGLLAPFARDGRS